VISNHRSYRAIGTTNRTHHGSSADKHTHTYTPSFAHLYQRQYLVRFPRLRQESRGVVPRGAAVAVGLPLHRLLEARDHLGRLEVQRAHLGGRGRRAAASGADLSKSEGGTSSRVNLRSRVADRAIISHFVPRPFPPHRSSRDPSLLRDDPVDARRRVIRTSSMSCAILSIAALSFVSASSAIVAVVVAGSSVALIASTIDRSTLVFAEKISRQNFLREARPLEREFVYILLILESSLDFGRGD